MIQPREIRDIAIECAGRLDGTVFTAMEVCTDTFFKRYRLACAFVLADVGDIINAVVRLQPELKPTEEEWVRVASQRRDAAPPPPGALGQELVRAEVETVVEYMRAIRQQDRDGSLVTAFEDFDEHLPKLMTTLRDWEPRP